MKLLTALKNSYLRSEIILVMDTVLSFAASLVSIYGVRLLTEGPFINARFLVLYLMTAVVATAALFITTRTYRIIIRHLIIKDIVPFGIAALGKALAILLVLSVAGFYSLHLLLIVVMDFLLTGVFLLGVRLCMILAYGLFNHSQQEHYNQQQIFIYGTSDDSVATLKRLSNSTRYRVNGFLERSDTPNKYLLGRLPVYPFNDRKQLDRILFDKKTDAILFSGESDVRAEGEGLISYCSQHGIQTLLAPEVDRMNEGKTLFHPREIKIEDLLGREETTVSLDKIKAYFAGKSVLVTGAAGSIGSELVRQLATLGTGKLILFDNAETAMHSLRLELEDRFKGLDFVPVIGDVRHKERLDFAFRCWHPQVVFHVAAYKHVPLMEENPCEAVLVNVSGSRNIADKCLEYGVGKMVLISTDKAVNPTSIMGCSKRLAEIYVQSLGLAVERGEKPGVTRFVTTRFGNVLGSNGSVIPRFREQIAKGGPVTVTHPEIKRYFMTIPEACLLVMEAATLSTGNEIFTFDMDEPVKIDDLARRMISFSGFTPDKDIKIEYTGLRPGEKLYEEVLSKEENPLSSFHERIRVAKVREYPYADTAEVTSRLDALAREVRIPDMIRLMKHTVPEFKSENSEYQAYDTQPS